MNKSESFPSGAAAIMRERERQIAEEGWTPAHDDAHARGEIAGAAVCYVLKTLSIPGQLGERARLFGRDLWPWAPHWWKPTDRRRNLVKAGALIAAEIDRLDRIDAARDKTPGADGSDKGNDQ